MRILYVGNAQGFDNSDRFYLFPQRLNNGFTRLGHNLYIFNDRDVARYSNILRSQKTGAAKMNAALIETCRKFAPELIVLGHCENVTNGTLGELREVLPDVKIIYRNVDPLSDLPNRAKIRHRAGIVDGIFITTAGPQIREFASNKTFSAFLPNPVDASIDTGRAFENSDYLSDVFFAGGDLGPQDHRRKILQYLLAQGGTDLTFKIHGCGINKDRLFGIDFIKSLSAAKMAPIINKTEDYYLYASDRMSQYMGNGIFILANEKPAYNDLFSKNEVVTYANQDDLLEKLKWYHHHDDERRKIAYNGWRKSHEIFNSTYVAQYIIDKTFGKTDIVYPWTGLDQ